MIPSGEPRTGLTGAVAARLARDEARIVVTGAGGWIGRASLELLSQSLGSAFPERVACFGSSDRLLQLRDGIEVPQRALAHLANLQPQPTLVLHLACLTKDRAEGMDAEAYAAANRAISRQVLEALTPMGARAVFLPSSGAAGQADDPAAPEALRLYGRLKREDEAAFAGWAERAGASAVIARVFNLSGPYINKQESYALACFIRDALARRPIDIKADRPVLRSYAAIREMMSVVLALMTREDAGVIRFDTAGDEALEMADLAAHIAQVLGHSQGVTRPPLRAGAAADVYLGEGGEYRRLRRTLGVESVAFPDQVRETARYLIETPVGY